ncbi:cupin domain-containing protein [Nocardiopsis sp. N85]|uniref:cupin domain-containing protein n=1 Tax=Nocardiopsis sp. N85 TaxID=3029400 RepID=UPI00237F0519|nr:cupin domain-containing protein [Nocardiopsis sp. N85]MDE3722931.1 cupin domain-containing protein [Nocardiopsis sp. N85]
MEDQGPEPCVLDIEDMTERNGNFRTAVWTGRNLQVTVMSIEPGGAVGLEVHRDRDQFLRVEAGEARVEMGPSRDEVDLVYEAGDGSAVLVPAGTWHNIVNAGEVPLKLYSVYAPAEHPHGTVHPTPADDPERPA